MTVFVRGPRRPDESEEDFLAREDAHLRQVEEAVQKLYKLRATHTGRMPAQEPKRTL